jgi:hypothetical protein
MEGHPFTLLPMSTLGQNAIEHQSRLYGLEVQCFPDGICGIEEPYHPAIKVHLVLRSSWDLKFVRDACLDFANSFCRMLRIVDLSHRMTVGCTVTQYVRLELPWQKPFLL